MSWEPMSKSSDWLKGTKPAPTEREAVLERQRDAAIQRAEAAEKENEMHVRARDHLTELVSKKERRAEDAEQEVERLNQLEPITEALIRAGENLAEELEEDDPATQHLVKAFNDALDSAIDFFMNAALASDPEPAQ